MTYKEAREFTASLSARGIKPGLDTIKELCARLGDPQDKLRIVHIAGTNGKGSAGAFIASIMRAADFSVGRYVSPAVTEYREIIRINDDYISREDYARVISQVKDASYGLYPTAFETETAAAFLYFARKRCGCAVIECGMGGELDATNIIKCPLASVITSVGLEHTKFLGDTIYDIAKSKAGIIKSGAPVFCARLPEDALTAVKEKCASAMTQLTICGEPEILSAKLSGTRFNYREYKNLYIGLAGPYQAKNAALAAEVCGGLGISARDTAKGLAAAKWQMRFETDADGWIYDGAHNPEAAYALRASLDALLNNKRLAFITGVFADKAYDEIMRITAPAARTIFTVKPPSERGLDSGILAECARRYCKDVRDAVTIRNAVRLCAGGGYDNVIVFGSLSFLSKIKSEKEIFYEQMSENN